MSTHKVAAVLLGTDIADLKLEWQNLKLKFKSIYSENILIDETGLCYL
jgi:hypothetical protein